MESIADSLAISDYDIVCLQEVWVYSNYELIRNRTKRRFPYGKFFHSGILGGGLVILSRYPILELSHHPYRLNGRPIKFTHGDWYVGKGAGSVLVDHPIAGCIEVFTTHTHAGYGSKKNDIYLGHRVSQAWELANILKSSAARGRNVIALGDFNNNPDSLLYKIITQHGQMIDAWPSQFPTTPASISTTSVNQQISNSHDPATAISQKGVTSNSPLNTWSNRTAKDAERECNAGERIDYVFYRKTSRFWCSNVKVVFTETIPELNCTYSDHFGVEAVFTLVGRDKNAVIPLSIWEQAAYDSLPDLETKIYQNLVDLLTHDLKTSISTARFHLSFFWISIVLILVGFIIEALVAGNVLKFDSWANIIILLAVTGLAINGVIFGLNGFLFGNSEQNSLKHIIDEVQSFVNGKKAYDSKRSSGISQNSSADQSYGQISGLLPKESPKN
ncbi:hypothetical protein G9A89_000173 [Geosiphon pyriformis]|nr:hypothetical protein G9A89_000173 [Geosiphon pyriformis]